MEIQYYGVPTTLDTEGAELICIDGDNEDKLIQVLVKDTVSLELEIGTGTTVTVFDRTLNRNYGPFEAGTESIDVPEDGVLVLTARAKPGYRFVEWYGEPGGVTDENAEILVNADDMWDFYESVAEVIQEQPYIQYYGIPSQTGSNILDCVTEQGLDAKILVDVIEYTPSEEIYQASLTRYDRGGSKTLYLPNIQTIEESDSASIAEISTITYGFEDNFVMDVGTKQSFTVTFDRVQPKTVTDPVKTAGMTDDMFWSIVDFDTQSSWSNAFWFNAFKHFIEGWQNLNYGIVDNEFQQTGGFRFQFDPGSERRRTNVSYSGLYPVIDENVVISGQMQYDFSPSRLQHMRLSLPLVSSTMIPNAHVQEQYDVRYYMDDGSQTYMIQRFPIGIDSITPNVPLDWIPKMNGAAFDHWVDINGNSYEPGERADDDIREFYGVWNPPLYAYFTADSDTDSDVRIEITQAMYDQGVRNVMYILIGAGGNGGNGMKFQGTYYGYGGGGGSGGYKTAKFKARVGDVIKLHAGKHGKGPMPTTIEWRDQKVTVSPGQTGGDAEGRNPSNITPGKGSAGGLPKGQAGEDATELRGGYGGDLTSIGFENYVVIAQNTGPQGIGPFSSKRGSSDQYGQCGVGGNGTRQGGINTDYGHDGLAIVILS